MVKGFQDSSILSDQYALKAQAEMEAFWESLDRESDRGMALAVGAFFDRILEDCLVAYLRQSKQTSDLLESGTGALGTFSSRNRLCFSLRIITSSQFNALRALASLRNAFAHRLMISFEDQELKSKTLQFGEHILGENKEVWEVTKIEVPRRIFSFSAFCLHDDLWLRPYDISLHARQFPELIPFHVDELMNQSNDP